MRVVYEAENLIDAHLVKGVLEEAGIPAFVRGEFLTGAMGELPVSGMLAVCVPEVSWPDAADLVAGVTGRSMAAATATDVDGAGDIGLEPA